MRHLEIEPRLVVRNVTILRIPGTRAEAVHLLTIKPIHAAMRPRKPRRTVASSEKGARRVRDVVTPGECDGRERDHAALRVFTARTRVGAGIALKQVVEAAVLLHDPYDMPDLEDAARHRWRNRPARETR